VEDGIPSEVLKSLLEILPRYRTAIYNRCLREGMFPKRWKKAMIIPIIILLVYRSPLTHSTTLTIMCFL